MKFSDVLKLHNGLGPGFDFLRIFLAFSIVGFHSMELTGNTWIYTKPFWFSEYALVPMFFALSGFLVAGSAGRLSLPNFLINRGLRILPALAVDIVVCSLVIGPIMTTVSIHEYFTSATFYEYYLNITGYIHYELPGVFAHNYSNRVNGGLWTVPYEMVCYFLMSFFMITNFIKRPFIILSLTFGLLIFGQSLQSSGVLNHMPVNDSKIVAGLFVRRGAQQYIAFMLGIFAFQMKEKIPYSRYILIFCISICALTSFVLTTNEMELVRTRFLLVPCLVYITIYFGLTEIHIPQFFKKGDYSYGVYLYHMPILQVVFALFPAIAMMHIIGGVFVFVAGAPFVLLLATGSWKFVEKPTLSLRKKFSFVARVRGIEAVPPDAIAPPDEGPTPKKGLEKME